jgi:hypothetical protein
VPFSGGAVRWAERSEQLRTWQEARLEQIPAEADADTEDAAAGLAALIEVVNQACAIPAGLNLTPVVPLLPPYVKHKTHLVEIRARVLLA